MLVEAVYKQQFKFIPSIWSGSVWNIWFQRFQRVSEYFWQYNVHLQSSNSPKGFYICVCMYVNIFGLISWPYKMHWTHCHIDLFTTCRVSKNRIHTFVHHFSPVTWSTAGIMHLTCAIFCDTAALITWSLSFFRKPSLRGAWLSSFFMVDDCWLSCFKDPSRFLVICHPGMAAVSDFIKFIKDHKTLKKNLVLDR